MAEGIVKKILTKSSSHPFGIKVLLENGIVGRVKEVIETSRREEMKTQILKHDQEIHEGEGQNIEFTSTFRFDLKRYRATGTKAINKEEEKSIAKTIAAFMNSQGGVLYISVDDDGNIIGLDEDYAFLEKPNSDRFRLKLKHCLEAILLRCFTLKSIRTFLFICKEDIVLYPFNIISRNSILKEKN